MSFLDNFLDLDDETNIDNVFLPVHRNDGEDSMDISWRSTELSADKRDERSFDLLDFSGVTSDDVKLPSISKTNSLSSSDCISSCDPLSSTCSSYYESFDLDGFSSNASDCYPFMVDPNATTVAGNELYCEEVIPERSLPPPCVSDSSVRTNIVTKKPHRSRVKMTALIPNETMFNPNSLHRNVCAYVNCCKVFPTAFDLRRHQEAEHPPLRCRFYDCTQEFRSKTALNKHLLKHNELFTCDNCNRHFSTKQTLTIHAFGDELNMPCLSPIVTMHPLVATGKYTGPIAWISQIDPNEKPSANIINLA